MREREREEGGGREPWVGEQGGFKGSTGCQLNKERI